MNEKNGQKYNRLLKKSRDTGMVNRLAGSSRPQSAALKKMVNWSSISFRVTEWSVKSHARRLLVKM